MMRKAEPAFLMAYFISEQEADGEQIRFAVSEPGEPTHWASLNDGRPVLRSLVGEKGARDPFLIRDNAREVFVLIATDLRVHPDGDWARATRHGSRSIVVWESPDLLHWSEARLAAVAPAAAGNTWAPKAFWSEQRDQWVVIWASAIYPESDNREQQAHQRLLAADTQDFSTFTDVRKYLDPGHDVIDATFLQVGDQWHRFSANAHAPGNPAHIGHHIFAESGTDLEDPNFAPVAIDVGRPALARGEGPAVFRTPGDDTCYLLIDEFGLRGYQLFELETHNLSTGEWRHIPEASLPPGARHGSVIPVSAQERSALLERDWT